MDQNEFKSVFNSPEYLGNNDSESDEQVADAFEDDYENELGETDEDVYEEEESDEESEDKSEQSIDVEALEKRIRDKDAYISQLQSKQDQLQSVVDKMSQQLDELSNNHNKEEGYDDYDPDEFLTRSEFEEREKKAKQRKESEAKMKQYEDFVLQVDQNLKKQQQYVSSRQDLEDVKSFASTLEKSGDQDLKEFMNHNQNNSSGLYMYLKYRKAEKELNLIKKKIKGKSKNLPPNNLGDSPVNRGSKKSGNPFIDSLMKNAVHSMKTNNINASDAISKFQK